MSKLSVALMSVVLTLLALQLGIIIDFHLRLSADMNIDVLKENSRTLLFIHGPLMIFYPLWIFSLVWSAKRHFSPKGPPKGGLFFYFVVTHSKSAVALFAARPCLAVLLASKTSLRLALKTEMPPAGEAFLSLVRPHGFEPWTFSLKGSRSTD